ncbi:MAG TPA: filamentous hemagglutinin, partial [Cyanobacteria bacterium UBA8543]|nr:filamentous hemagglutinin [Cyanobacteria bacterium UBA8543]
MECRGRSLFSTILLTVTSSMTLCCLTPLSPATGQITPDRTLGTENSIVTPNVNIKDIPSDQIDGGAIRGTNLFHSFAEFNVDTGRGVYFINPSGIENILSRVTGGNPSNILGTLGVLGKANLFLINPNGIVFGSKAKLDVGGSFVASTASAITFTDGTFFSATDISSPPLLTINMPVGLQYRANAGSIQVEESRLSVPKGKTLALVGGAVGLDGASLKVPEGTVALAGVAGLGTVELNVDSNDLRLSFPNDLALADISLINKSVVDVSGEGGGAIQVQGRQVTFADESKISAITTGDRNGQGIYIYATQFTINSGAQVSASTTGAGNGGNVDIVASDLVELIGTSADGEKPSRLANDLQRASGTAGNLTITTSRLIVRDGARISASASGTGLGGNIDINASDSVELIGTLPGDRRPSGVSVQTSQGTAKAGDLTITTSQLSIQNGAEVSAASFGDGDGGTVNVNASESVELIGTSANGKLPSRLFAGTGKPSDVKRDGNSQSDDIGDASDVSTGNGGNLIVNTRHLTVQNGAQISVGSQGTGNAGDLEI